MERDRFWYVIVVVAMFSGFLLGYSFSPMVEVGILGGEGEEIGIKTDTDAVTEDYYKNLMK